MILKILLLPLLATITLAPLAAGQTALSSEQLAKVASSCVQAQVNLQRVQYSDTAARINSGRAYESLLSNLVAPFNSRAALNRIFGVQILTTATSDFEQIFDSYKKNYTSYEISLESVLRINCAAMPADFYSRLETTRQQRSQLAGDIAAMNKILASYQQEIKAITARQSTKSSQVQQ